MVGVIATTTTVIGLLWQMVLISVPGLTGAQVWEVSCRAELRLLTLCAQGNGHGIYVETWRNRQAAKRRLSGGRPGGHRRVGAWWPRGRLHHGRCAGYPYGKGTRLDFGSQVAALSSLTAYWAVSVLAFAVEGGR